MTGKALFDAKQEHEHQSNRGFGASRCLGNFVLMTQVVFSFSGLEDALQVRSAMAEPTVSSVRAIISGYIKARRGRDALSLYKSMCGESLKPNKYMVISLLRACGTECDLAAGKLIHSEVRKHSCLSDLVVRTCLLGMYAKCGSIVDAQSVFDGLPQRDVVAWTALISAYTDLGQAGKALFLYEQMLEEAVSPNDRTCVGVLRACAMLTETKDAALVAGRPTTSRSLRSGKAIHAYAWTKGYSSDLFVSNTLVSMYGKCGSYLDAECVFGELHIKNCVSWNAMLAACVEHGQGEKAFEVYQQMREYDTSPDDRTLMTMVQACGQLSEQEDDILCGQGFKLKSMGKGRALHAYAREKECLQCNFVGSTLVNMYASCGSIADAKFVFDGLFQPNVVSWTALLLAYAREGKAEKALQLYEEMRDQGESPNDWTFVSLLQACGILAEEEDAMVVDGRSFKLNALAKGKAIHAETRKMSCDSDVFVGNALVSMYGKCGSTEDAQGAFAGLSSHDVVSWTSLLAAYTRQGHEEKALQLYRQMQAEGATPNEITLVSILQACSNIGCLDLCRQIHHTLLSAGNGLSPLVGNSLVHAYGRCSSMADAESVFCALTVPDVVSWTALIAGHARQGNWTACLRWYEAMQAAGVKPDSVTFLSLMSACSYAGFVETGLGYFESMSRDYGITAEVEHYASMVDLLASAGCFARVQQLLSEMPVQPNVGMWLCILGACRKYGELDLGKVAFRRVVDAQPRNAAAYALMSNIYANAGQWDRALELQEMKQKVGASQNPGQSWIAIAEEVHNFVVSDGKDSEQEHVLQTLGNMSSKLEEIHYVSPVLPAHHVLSSKNLSPGDRTNAITYLSVNSCIVQLLFPPSLPTRWATSVASLPGR